MQHENEKIENAKLAEFYGILSGVKNYEPLPLASDRINAENEAYENGRLAFRYAALALDEQ